MDPESFNVSRYCCDPFGRHKKKISKSLRFLTKKLIAGNSNPKLNLTTKHKVCPTCRGQLAKAELAKSAECERDSSSNGSQAVFSAESMTDCSPKNDYELKNINSSLATLSETPLKRYRLSQSSHYKKKKFKKVSVAVKRKIELVSGAPFSSESDLDDKTESEILQQLKEKFNETENRSEKLTILTILPQSWSRKMMMNSFKCSDYMARQAKTLVREKGVLSSPNPRLGKPLAGETVTIATDFYHSPDISREMPGMKDYVSVKGADGCREKKTKVSPSV